MLITFFGVIIKISSKEKLSAKVDEVIQPATRETDLRAVSLESELRRKGQRNLLQTKQSMCAVSPGPGNSR